MFINYNAFKPCFSTTKYTQREGSGFGRLETLHPNNILSSTWFLSLNWFSKLSPFVDTRVNWLASKIHRHTTLIDKNIVKKHDLDVFYKFNTTLRHNKIYVKKHTRMS